MPIVLEPGDGPLRQGDILQGVLMFMTEDTDAMAHSSELCVVLSRDCKAFRGKTVLVSPIIPYNGPIAEALDPTATFDTSLRRMSALRDGDSRPDEVYLGPLNGNEKRCCVAISEIYTIGVPADAREDWVRKYRTYRLEADFVRHLQVRLGMSIQRQGFDDFQWWPLADLQLVLQSGTREVASLEAEQANLKAQIGVASAEGQADKIRGLEKKIGTSEKKVGKVKSKIREFEDEITRRDCEKPE